MPRYAMALALAATSCAACTARVYPATVAGYEAVYVDTVPVDIYAYPHVWYGGGYAYLVDNRWYYPGERGWVVLRSEPPELLHYRSQHVQRAPPAYDYSRQYAPPAHYSYPPPATRVR
jgi:hypothetical protein